MAQSQSRLETAANGDGRGATRTVGGDDRLASSHRAPDLLLRHRFLEARVWVPAICYLGAVLLLIPGILESHFTPAVWFDAERHG